MDKNKYKIAIITLFILLLFSISIFSVIGTVDVSIKDTIRIILSKIPNKFYSKVDISDIPRSTENIIWNVRLPRILLGVLVGMSLSIAGVAFQGMFKNPMADPYVIGISSGAALGATLSIVFKFNITILNIPSTSIFAFIGSLLSVFLVYTLAKVNNKIPINNLLLSGVAIGQFFTAIMSFIMVIFDKDMKKVIYWTMGGLSGKGWKPIKRLGIPLLLSFILMYFYSKDLNILLTGEDTARSLGLDVTKTRRRIILLGSFMTSLVVSVSGVIGFVGLIIPHITRMLFGPDHRILIPAASLIGGIFMIFTDTIARTIISPVEIPVGVITSLFGGPFFIYLLKVRKENIG